MFNRCPVFMHVLFLVCFVGLPGCGGGDKTPAEPFLVIDFPAPVSHVEDVSSPTITVRGRAAGDDIRVVVNGVEAVSEDGFATWQAVVPLPEGAGSTVVSAVLEARGTQVATAGVTVHAVPPLMATPQIPVRDPATGRVFVGDATRDALYVWDPVSPERVELVAGENRRTSALELPYPERPVWDPVARRLLFLGGRSCTPSILKPAP